MPRKVTGINGGEAQAISFGDETLWLHRLMWAELHGEVLVRWQWDDIVKKVPGALEAWRGLSKLDFKLCEVSGTKVKPKAARVAEFQNAPPEICEKVDEYETL